MVRVGVVARPHGVRGMLAVTLDNAESDSLFHVDHVHLDDVRFDVLKVQPGRQGQVVLQVKGVDTPEAVDALRGREVRLTDDQLPALDEGEFWQRDLLGLVATDEAGNTLGEVVEIVDTADVPVLVLKGAAGEVFVPLIAPYLVHLDPAEKKLVVSPPEVLE